MKFNLFKNILVVGFLSTVFSCAVSKTKLTEEGNNIRILSDKRNTGCNVVAKVVGENDEGLVDLAKNHARNLAAKKEADAVFFDETVTNGAKIRVSTIAYKCN